MSKMFVVTFERLVPDNEAWQHTLVYAGTGLYTSEAHALHAIKHIFGREPISMLAWAPRGVERAVIPGQFSNGNHPQASIVEIVVDQIPDVIDSCTESRGCGATSCQ